MNPGFWKIVHHPVVRMSSAGRNDDRNRPNVGMVQRTAMMIDAIVAVREVSRFLTRATLVPGSVSASSAASTIGEFLADGEVGGGDAAHRISLCLRSTLTL